MHEGDYLCSKCFTKRKDSASSSSYQSLYEKNWGLYFVPVVGLSLLASRIKKDITEDCTDVYHIYIDGKHEVWHNNRTNEYNKKRCEGCKDYNIYYYELVDLKD